MRLGYVDAEGLARIEPDATVVFVMNHRSNMDYVLAGYLAADQTALSYAVGEWARIWPLSALIRSMGAYFVRRNSKDELYRRVLERYIAMATEAGVPQAVFPEGGLTRDGRMREPRLGVLDYMMRGFRMRRRARPGVRAAGHQLRPRAGGPHAAALARPGRDAARARRGALEHARLRRCTTCGLMLRSEWHRFGYACVNFGSPVSMREYCRERGLDFQQARRARSASARWPSSAAHLMDAVGRIVPVRAGAADRHRVRAHRDAARSRSWS